MSKILNEKLNKLSEDEKELWALRHTAEHVLHAAMQNLYPSLKKAMGPATPEGFYFDFDLDQKINEEDFPKIENEVKRIIDKDLKMEQKYLNPEKARKIFSNNPYKLEWIDEIEKRGEEVSVYSMGNEDVDLCSGPHAASTGKVKALKLLSVAGAYWHGDEKNKMLQRIYGTCFSTEKELNDYLVLLEKAKLNDHRKLGRELELFALSDEVGPGLILWLPKGNIIKEEVEKWAKKTEENWGYQRVTTPNITKAGLYYTSGHLPYYKEDMYPPMKLAGEEEEYYLKPMNCPHHHMIYKSRPRSYKELPLRLAEYGVCYRYEASGQLFGLMRVRGFSQNDSHIYCSEEDAVSEFVNVMKLHEYYYKTLGINDYYLELALRDSKNTKKYHGNEKMWILAEKLMREAVSKVKIKMVEQVGNAAFYGPKIDFIVKSSIGREFAISTNQIDLFMGEQFGLKYTDRDGKEKTPVIIHRAPLGSHERFIGFLIEHFGGSFPVWMSPVQIKILPITDRNLVYANKILNKLKASDLRVEVDDRSETLGAKIRNAQKEKVPYVFVIGDKEQEKNMVALRLRDGKDLGITDPDRFIKEITKKIEEKSLTL